MSVMPDKEILICAGTGCLSAGAEEIEAKLLEELAKRGLSDQFPVKEVIKKTGCLGPCSLGPTMIILPEKVIYGKVQVADVVKIVDEHLLKGQVVEELLLEDQNHHKITEYTELLKGQLRIALRNTGLIDPNNIQDYLAKDGYKALEKVLTQMTPWDVVTEMKASGLRGRGGAGFPTGIKWELTAKAEGTQKYVVCNADEGDPGAFMDRSVLEGDPHSVIEAMAIAGYAIGADQGYVYVRAEYPLAIKNLSIAIEDARGAGYLGENIFGTAFKFDVEIRVGAGAFVCGEETALMASIEGKRGQPRSKPPFPANSGLWAKPTLINNVETYANIPPIILNGAAWYAGIGTATSKGTKVFAVAGDVNNTGLVEVPMGTTLREIVYDISGGIPHGKEFKAAQTGGPSGGVISAEYLDLPIDYESLKTIGAIVGSGGLIIMDEENCMVDVARFFLEFTQDESCGKCTPCRIGTKKMLEILERVTQGEGQPDDIEKLQDLAQIIKETSLCGLGQTAPNPVLSTLNFFRSEYEAHIKEKKCPARQCKALLDAYSIDAAKCIGCGLCARKCAFEAITGERRQPHRIDPAKCTVCGTCVGACPVQAII